MAKRRTAQPAEEITLLKKPKEVFKKELQERIELGEALNNRIVNEPIELDQVKKEYADWNDYNKELLKRAFNKSDNEYAYSYRTCTNMVGFADVAYRKHVNTLHYQLKLQKEIINVSVVNLKRLVEKLPLIESDASLESFNTASRSYTNRCFLVHGHDETRKFETARFIENDLKRRVIILHEQANAGRTIIEKFEHFSKVDFAVALWTADDLGRSKSGTDLSARARQNVIFETGFFIGALGRKNVIVLYEDHVEIPSDYSGVIFIKIAGNWKDELRKEVEAIYDLS